MPRHSAQLAEAQAQLAAQQAGAAAAARAAAEAAEQARAASAALAEAEAAATAQRTAFEARLVEQQVSPCCSRGPEGGGEGLGGHLRPNGISPQAR